MEEKQEGGKDSRKMLGKQWITKPPASWPDRQPAGQAGGQPARRASLKPASYSILKKRTIQDYGRNTAEPRLRERGIEHRGACRRNNFRRPINGVGCSLLTGILGHVGVRSRLLRVPRACCRLGRGPATTVRSARRRLAAGRYTRTYITGMLKCPSPIYGNICHDNVTR